MGEKKRENKAIQPPNNPKQNKEKPKRGHRTQGKGRREGEKERGRREGKREKGGWETETDRQTDRGEREREGGGGE